MPASPGHGWHILTGTDAALPTDDKIRPRHSRESNVQRILIVDPDSAFRGRARGALERLRCDVVDLESAEAALKVMLEDVPALIIAGCD
jgi:hypothetical protein